LYGLYLTYTDRAVDNQSAGEDSVFEPQILLVNVRFWFADRL